MNPQKQVTTTRDIEVTEIPSGTPISIPAGTPLSLVQSLGGSFTVLTPYGYMARVDGNDGDAIGETAEAPKAAAGENKTIDELCWDELKTCYDPEIPVNIVDLGLVYKCEVTALPDGGNKVEVRFTLTAPGCGMGDVLRDDIRKKLLAVPGITDADVQVLFDPPWNLGMMSDAAKLQLGML
ncbi:MAG TPA: putative Fe-S cluster assembly protein SufT [Thermoanaerobaculia bacterium]